MPSINIDVFNKNGRFLNLHSTKEIGYGSFNTKVELALEKKYLPEITDYSGSPTSRCFKISDFTFKTMPEMQEIWDLILDKRLTRQERIVLGFGFYRSVVFVENKSELIAALKDFGKEHDTQTSCIRIAEIIENNNDSEIIAYHTSSSGCGSPFSEKYNEKTDKYTYYNLFKGKKHFNLFDYIIEIENRFVSC